MESARSLGTGWLPLAGSYEESVLSWNEQVERLFRRRDRARSARVGVATAEALDSSETPCDAAGGVTGARR